MRSQKTRPAFSLVFFCGRVIGEKILKLIRLAFFAAIIIWMTNHAHSDGWEEAVTEESPAIASAILEFVDEALLDGPMSGGMEAFVDEVYNYADSVKDKIAGTVTQTPTENIE